LNDTEFIDTENSQNLNDNYKKKKNSIKTKDLTVINSTGEKVKISAVSDVGKSLYEKMEKNLVKFNKNDKNSLNEDQTLEIVKLKEGNNLNLRKIS